VPLALAHRGDWSAAPENTVAAFRAAERAGADMVELDVRRTVDGAVVVVHDPTLHRVWGSPLDVARATLDELLAVRVGDHGIATFDEALRCVSLPVMVDYEVAEVVEPALEAIEAAGALHRVLFSGGNVAGHHRIRELAPEARIALTWTRREAPSDELLDGLDPEYLNPPWELVDARVVEAMHARGRKLSTWTVDDPEEMRRLIELGVDAIVTNRIEELVSLLAETPC
jgi:glycerophosphoryl diester phosphodiesterase